VNSLLKRVKYAFPTSATQGNYYRDRSVKLQSNRVPTCTD